jgi:hypothetical protein
MSKAQKAVMQNVLLTNRSKIASADSELSPRQDEQLESGLPVNVFDVIVDGTLAFRPTLRGRPTESPGAGESKLVDAISRSR